MTDIEADLRAFYAADRAALDRMARADDPTPAMDPEMAAAWRAVDDAWTGPPPPRPLAMPPPWILVAAAAALLMAVGWRFATSEPGLRIKGQPTARLVVLASRGAGPAFAVEPDARLRPGDTLGFFVAAEAPGGVAVYLVDAAGATRLAPSDGRSGRHPAGALVRLPEGARMTPGDGCEWIVAAFSSGEPPVERLDRALAPDPDACRPPRMAPVDGVRWQRLRVRR